MMIYPSVDDYFGFVFDAIRALVYDDATKPPAYEKDVNGVKQLSTILELVQNDLYYPTFQKKSAYLFTSLSTGHHFENGNKRIALFSYIYFIRINKFKFRGIRKKKYKEWFMERFPKYELFNKAFSSVAGWAMYNLNRAINIKDGANGHSYSFDKLKEILEEFTDMIVYKKIA